MIVASASVDMPAGSARLQVRADGQFDFFVCVTREKKTVYFDFSGPIGQLPLAAEGLQLCFRALPPAILASLIPTATNNPDKPT